MFSFTERFSEVILYCVWDLSVVCLFPASPLSSGYTLEMCMGGGLAHSLRDDGRPEGEEVSRREPQKYGPETQEDIGCHKWMTLKLQTV